MRIFTLIAFFMMAFILTFNNGCFLEENLKSEDPYTWNFGEVEEGSILKHTFMLENKSKNTLIIKNVRTSCGCTGSVVSNSEIPPGEASQIEVTFDTKGYSGKTEQFVFVYTDDSENPVVKLTVVTQVVKNK